MDMKLTDMDTVAILGGGNGAHAMAADLCAQGKTVRLYEMPEFRPNLQKLFETKTIECSGAVNGTFELDKVTDDIDEAVSGAGMIIIVTPAYAHKAYAKLLKGHIAENQIVAMLPGAFSSLILKKEFGDLENYCFAESNDLPYNARLTEPCKVFIQTMNAPSYAVFPADKTVDVMPEIEKLFNVGGTYEDVVECGLALINPSIHSGACLINAGPIEYKPVNFFLYEHGFTPSAAKLDKALDEERKAVAAKIGYDIHPFDCFATIKGEYKWQDLYQSIHGDIGLTPIAGPNDLYGRYFTEDAPCGLVPWSHLGKLAGVPTNTIDSIVNLYCIIHETDWWKKGTTLDDLGLTGMTVEDIRHYCKDGSKK